jgi:phosphomannomutase
VGSFERFRKLLRPLGAIGLTGAAAVLVNRGLRASGPLPVDHIGGVRRRWQWRGYDIFATELGEGPPLLLVHGIYAGASSYEFRKIAPLLAKHHRVIAFDLLGCGLSEMPDVDYSAELFVEQIVDAIGEFASEPLTLVASSLGAAFAVRAAARVADRVRHLVLSCPTGLGILDADANAAQRAITSLIRSPVVGEAAFNGLSSRPSIAWFLRNQSYASPASATPEVVDHYYAVAHQPGARYVPAFFVGGGLNCDVARDLPFVEAPILILWGEQASKTSPLERAQEFVRLAKDARLVTLSESGILPLEEEPDKCAEAIEAFVAVPSAERAEPAEPVVAPEPVATSESVASVAADPVPQTSEPQTVSFSIPDQARVSESAPAPQVPPVTQVTPVPPVAPIQQTAPASLLPDLSAIFKSYDVRGIYPSEFNDEIAYGIGRAFVEQLGLTSIVVGRDMRPSGEKLFAAFAAGANDAGADVTDIGLVSTDALYFAVGKYGFAGGVMITASHNPAEYNGMKFTRDRAQAISLETGLAQIRDRVASGKYGPLAARRGTISHREILDEFATHCLSFIDPATIKPFKIAIDAGNGMAGLTVPHVFDRLPCQVIPLFFELDGTFPNHPASPIEPENMVALQKAVIENQCDLGAAFDGDADRMFLVDEKGGLIGGDMVTALVGINTLKRDPGAKILYNLICSRSVPEAIERAGGVPLRSPVGHSLIKKIMRDEDIVFGGEHSGHFYFRNNWFADSGMIALLQCLEVFSEANAPVSAVVAPIDTRFRSGEVNSRVRDIPAKLAEIRAHYKDGKVDYLDGLTIAYPDWWMNVRPSNTEPLLRLNVEGDTKELMERHRDEALALIRS